MKAVRIGCSGWNYKSWRGLFYPEGLPASRWLPHYAEHFDTVEVNATFYRLPTREAVANWVEQTPDEFIFSIKASRYLTHIKRLRELPDGIARLRERIEPLLETPKMGPVLWQLPGNFRRDDERLAEALAEPVLDMLREHGVALTIGDHPERPFQSHERTADWMFVRLHYGHRGRRGNYSEAELAQWRDRIAAWRRRAEVFVYLNNDWEGFAIRNAAWLRDRLS